MSDSFRLKKLRRGWLLEIGDRGYHYRIRALALLRIRREIRHRRQQ